MGIAVFLLAPVAADPVVAVAELAVLKSMAAYSALFSGSSISIDGTPPQLCSRRHFHDQNISFCSLQVEGNFIIHLVATGVPDASAVSLGAEGAPLAARRPGVLLGPGPAVPGDRGGGVAAHVHWRSAGRSVLKTGKVKITQPRTENFNLASLT